MMHSIATCKDASVQVTEYLYDGLVDKFAIDLYTVTAEIIMNME